MSFSGLYDTWLLLLWADQLGSLAEKEFLENQGREMAGLAVFPLILNMKGLKKEKEKEVFRYAVDLLVERGIRKEHIFPEKLPAPSEEEIINMIKSWVGREIKKKDFLRVRAVSSQMLKIQPEILQEIENSRKVQLGKPQIGKNFMGDQFFTDSKAYIITVQ